MSKTFENILAFHASPALLGIKSSNLISISLKEIPNLLEEIEQFNNELGHKLSLFILRINEDRALILIYKYKKLYNAIFDSERREYLISCGYPNSYDINEYLNILKERIHADSFPHEIGIFLGYDFEDTLAFLNNDKKCIYVGYWKVYKDKEKKIEIFDRYTKCRNIISSLLNKGYSLENLIA